MYLDYEDETTLSNATAEMGVKPDELLAGLQGALGEEQELPSKLFDRNLKDAEANLNPDHERQESKANADSSKVEHKSNTASEAQQGQVWYQRNGV